MGTVVNDIDNMAKELKDAFTDFLLNHSKIDPPRPYTDEVCCLTPEGDRSFDFMDAAGLKVQAALKIRYNIYYSTLYPLFEDQPEDVLAKMKKLNEVVIRTIEHRITWCENTKQALDRVLRAVEDQLILMKAIK